MYKCNNVLVFIFFLKFKYIMYCMYIEEGPVVLVFNWVPVAQSVTFWVRSYGLLFAFYSLSFSHCIVEIQLLISSMVSSNLSWNCIQPTECID